MARGGQDDEATRILCRTAMTLHVPRSGSPPRNLVPLQIWFEALAPAATTQGGVFVTSYDTARVLLSDPRDQVVLHGDYHHDNVLDGRARGWLAIDPKGLVGERAFEFANLLRNPDAATALAEGRIQRQAKIACQEARLDMKRLLHWVLAYAGLSSAWSLQSGDDPRPGLAIAERAAAELAA